MSSYNQVVKSAVTRRNTQVRKTTTEANTAKRKTAEAYRNALAMLEADNAAAQMREKENLDALLQQLMQDYQHGSNALENDTTAALREAYLNMRTAQRDLPQQLAAEFASGGMAESVAAGLRSSYGNNRAELMASKLQALMQMEQALGKNKLDLNRGYNDTISGLEAAYTDKRNSMAEQKNTTMLEIDKAKNASRQASDNALTQQIVAARTAQAKAQQDLQLAQAKAQRDLELALLRIAARQK